MSQTEDIEYFRKRAIEERQRAAEAAEGCIACVHTAMADRYENLMKAAVSTQLSDRPRNR